MPDQQGLRIGVFKSLAKIAAVRFLENDRQKLIAAMHANKS
jgi:hypothetical protein